MSSPRSDNVRLVAGCMTGTSLDGLDVALVKIEGHGLTMKATLLHHLSHSLGSLAGDLRRFAEGVAAPPLDYLRAARALGRLHAQAVAQLCAEVRPDFVVAHGQTIWHAPRRADDLDGESLSWQLFDPWPLVRALHLPVCYDLRQADLIAGGQGAPITPIADWVMYRVADQPRVIVNLGGICNITVISADITRTAGGDVCPCNIILDGVVQRLFPAKRFDEDGRIASSGNVIPMLAQAIVIDLWQALESQRSLGREQFPMSLLDGWVATAKRYEKYEDIVASYVAAVADLVVAGIRRSSKAVGKVEVILAGGGAKNPALERAISTNDQADFHCIRTDDLGIPCEAREAMAFAVLGALSQDGVPITLPAVTGALMPGKAGAWVYP